MVASEHDECLGIEGLHADRHARESGGTPRGEIVVGAIGRVRLDRDLAWHRAVVIRDRADRLREAVGAPQRRRAATEVDRSQLTGERGRAGP